jgi:hypothetical protein
MDKKIASLVGAMGALAASGQVQAAPATHLDVEAAMQATSYADLLKPIPNAVELWKASASMPAPQVETTSDPAIIDVQDHHHHHHHHHHRRHHRRIVVPLPHHHHHHHHAAVVVVPPQN